jgi:hypothetical protein
MTVRLRPTRQTQERLGLITRMIGEPLQVKNGFHGGPSLTAESLSVNQVGIGSNPMGHPPNLGERISVLHPWVRRLTGGFRSCKAAVRVRFPPNPPTTSAARGHARIAQLVERHVEGVGVGGSSPSPGTTGPA